MSVLASELETYLALRRSMGYKLERAEKLLRQFVRYAEDRHMNVLSVEAALTWARLPEGASTTWVYLRLGVLRPYSRHLALIDSSNEIIPTSLVPDGPHRATPYLFCIDEVRAMMAATKSFRSPLRQASYETIVGLLWATGMRVGEALALRREDVDLVRGVLRVHKAKFGKSRELPVHETTMAALARYAERRNNLCPNSESRAFFVSAVGTPVLSCNFHSGFQQLLRQAGIQPRSQSCRPRPHDMRHSFAVRSLIGWYRDGLDVQAYLPKLSTYLGHTDPVHTYWYLSAAPELLHLAADRLEAEFGEQP